MNWFKNIFDKPLDPIVFDFLVCDIHSHLIPGIDDGSPDLETSIKIINNLKELGFKKMITTPHIMSDYYRNTPEIILDGLAKLKKELTKQNIDFDIEAAAEYYVDYDFSQKLENEKLLTFGDNYLLIETSFIARPPNFDQIIFQIQLQKYKIVLAHPERYQFMSLSDLKDLKQKNIFLQLNLLSLIGYYGKTVQKRAQELIDLEMIDFVGTDCHNVLQSEMYNQVQTNKYFHKLVSQNKLTIQQTL